MEDEVLDFIAAVRLMYEEFAVMIPVSEGWDNRCVMLYSFRGPHDNEGRFQVVRPKSVNATGTIAYDASCVLGEYRFSAEEMLSMRFRQIGPWFFEVWTKEVRND